jgi:hypothetical protein
MKMEIWPRDKQVRQRAGRRTYFGIPEESLIKDGQRQVA